MGDGTRRIEIEGSRRKRILLQIVIDNKFFHQMTSQEQPSEQTIPSAPHHLVTDHQTTRPPDHQSRLHSTGPTWPAGHLRDICGDAAVRLLTNARHVEANLKWMWLINDGQCLLGQ